MPSPLTEAIHSLDLRQQAASAAASPEMDRVMKDVVPPPRFPLTEEEIFSVRHPRAPHASQLLPDIPRLREHLLKEGRLTKPACLRLIRQATARFRSEPNVLEIGYPVTVVGDIHGQFFDMMQMFKVGGDPTKTQYLFLGDYVDRGCFSTEVIWFLYALKIAYPRSIWMLRGNHECRALTAFFNFKDECLYKYDVEVYDAIMESFDALPIAAVVNKSFFCVHGGLSPDIRTIDDIRKLHRFQEIPRSGALCDLLWSDPFDEETAGQEGFDDGDAGAMRDSPSSGGPQRQTPQKESSSGPGKGNKPVLWYEYNKTRQCSFMYGIEAVREFLERNKLVSIIRAHEAQVDGYKMQLVNPETGIPRVITVFSAPNYCDVYQNRAACLKFDHKVLNIKQFVETEHPYYLPNFMDVFEWSLPFVAEKVTDMLASILEAELKPPRIQEFPGDASPGDPMETSPTHPSHTSSSSPDASDEALDPSSSSVSEDSATMVGGAEEEDPFRPASLLDRGPAFRKKVLAVTRLLRMYRTLRQDHESILQLKQLTPDNQIPRGLLGKGSEEIQKALSSYQQAKEADLANERMPHAPPQEQVVHSLPSDATLPSQYASLPSSPPMRQQQQQQQHSDNDPGMETPQVVLDSAEE